MFLSPPPWTTSPCRRKMKPEIAKQSENIRGISQNQHLYHCQWNNFKKHKFNIFPRPRSCCHNYRWKIKTEVCTPIKTTNDVIKKARRRHQLFYFHYFMWKELRQKRAAACFLSWFFILFCFVFFDST